MNLLEMVERLYVSPSCTSGHFPFVYAQRKQPIKDKKKYRTYSLNRECLDMGSPTVPVAKERKQMHRASYTPLQHSLPPFV